MHGCDQPLARTVVPDRAASGLDPAGQRRVAHEPVAPDVVEQLGLGDHPVAMVSRKARTSKTCGSTCTGSPSRRSSTRAGSRQQPSNAYTRRPSEMLPALSEPPADPTTTQTGHGQHRVPQSWPRSVSTGSPHDLHAVSMSRRAPVGTLLGTFSTTRRDRHERNIPAVGHRPRGGPGRRDGRPVRGPGAQRAVRAGDADRPRPAAGRSRRTPRGAAGPARARLPGARRPGRRGAVPGSGGRARRGRRLEDRRPVRGALQGRRPPAQPAAAADRAGPAGEPALPGVPRPQPGRGTAERPVPRLPRGGGAHARVRLRR